MVIIATLTLDDGLQLAEDWVRGRDDQVRRVWDQSEQGLDDILQHDIFFGALLHGFLIYDTFLQVLGVKESILLVVLLDLRQFVQEGQFLLLVALLDCKQLSLQSLTLGLQLSEPSFKQAEMSTIEPSTMFCWGVKVQADQLMIVVHWCQVA